MQNIWMPQKKISGTAANNSRFVRCRHVSGKVQEHKRLSLSPISRRRRKTLTIGDDFQVLFTSDLSYMSHLCACTSVTSARNQLDAEISPRYKSAAFSLEVAFTASSNFLHAVKFACMDYQVSYVWLGSVYNNQISGLISQENKFVRMFWTNENNLESTWIDQRTGHFLIDISRAHCHPHCMNPMLVVIADVAKYHKKKWNNFNFFGNVIGQIQNSFLDSNARTDMGIDATHPEQNEQPIGTMGVSVVSTHDWVAGHPGGEWSVDVYCWDRFNLFVQIWVQFCQILSVLCFLLVVNVL